MSPIAPGDLVDVAFRGPKQKRAGHLCTRFTITHDDFTYSGYCYETAINHFYYKNSIHLPYREYSLLLCVCRGIRVHS